MHTVDFHGWKCLAIESGNVVALVTLDVGPRVISLGFRGRDNLFYVKPETCGTTGHIAYQGYGGHRLWVAPESEEQSYYPENGPVLELADGFLASAVDGAGLQRCLRVAPGPIPGSFEVVHRLTNHGSSILKVAPWALSVMRAGGQAFVPMPPYAPHGMDHLLPVSQIALWSYTNLADPRFGIHQEGITLKQTSDPGSQKVGVFVPQGYAAYWVDKTVFLKTFPAVVGATYPDQGCNFETYTRHDMLEVESLGPLVELNPGSSTEHVERWAVQDHSLPDWDELAIIAAATGYGRL